jgi:hypothetical protein
MAYTTYRSDPCSSQTTTAKGIVAASGAISQVAATMTTPDTTLTSSIADASSGIAQVTEGGKGVPSFQVSVFYHISGSFP